MALTVIAAYDITDDGRRSRLAALLQAFGDRIQKSVFVLQIDHAGMDEVRERARDIIDFDDDSLYLFAQCGTCWERVECHGQAAKPDRVLYWAVW
jgi:CRISPR-associated protein Cas2